MAGKGAFGVRSKPGQEADEREETVLITNSLGRPAVMLWVCPLKAASCGQPSRREFKTEILYLMSEV